MTDIIVIGGGVIGLSSALASQAAGFAVRLITKEAPLSTTSVAAGAVWSGSELEGRSRQWAAHSLERFQALAGQADSGVAIQRMREVYAEDMPDPWYRDRLPFFQRLSRHELPPGLSDGYLMDLPMVAPPIYLRNLEEQFRAAGGEIEIRELDALEQLAEEAALLVNCSGVGARELAGDAGVYPIRGQTLLLEAPDIRLGYMDNSRVDHLFPRVDGLLVGGLKIKGEWNREIDPQVSADILERCARIDRRVARAKVLRQFTGLRPGRAEPRLEIETLTPRCRVIHNYGHGAVGYTLSWGCAAEVAALARSALKRD